MIIKPATTQEEVKAVLCHPEIYDCISGDGAPPREEWQVQGSAVYLTGYIDDEPIAVMVYHPKNLVCWQCHIQVLPDYRDHAFEFAQKALSWFWDNSKAVKLIAEIPSKYRNVLSFALRCGFDVDGRTDNAYIKNGNLYSMYYLSLERP